MKMIIDLSEEEYRTIRHIAGTQHWRNKRTAEQIVAVGDFLATGHWIKEKSRYGWDGKSYVCSECGRSIHLDSDVEDLTDYPYCHCGAEMIERR